MNNINPTSYNLQCVKSGRVFADEGWTLDDEQCDTPSLVRAIYENRELEVGAEELGIYKFASWMPICRTLEGSAAPATYKSEGLANCLGLENLYLTISGYYPEKGAHFSTCSFKETEAFSVCGRMNGESDRVLVVSSAGNTARAFAKVCSQNNIKLLLCVPCDNLDALWFDTPLNECVKLISVESGGDYFDAIHLGNVAAKHSKYYSEGGAKNVARRDGMATTFLSATTFIGQIPDFYFQGVGSGTGAIAAWEANLRFIADGRFGATKTKLMLSQNSPFTPMFEAWEQKSRALLPFDDADARCCAEEVDAKVLTNRRPPYSISGGLYDALCDSCGEIFKVDNSQIRAAQKLFEQVEGIDIHSAAATAIASLIEAVKMGKIAKNQNVMVNITGAGEERYKAEHELFYLKPCKIFEINPKEEEILSFVDTIF